MTSQKAVPRPRDHDAARGVLSTATAVALAVAAAVCAGASQLACASRPALTPARPRARQSTATPSQQRTVFTAQQYRDMVEDTARTSSYYSAIDSLAPGKVVLDLGTGPYALLAVRCAQASARRVYAVEACPEAAGAAREAVAAAGAADIVDVLSVASEAVTLPEKVDLVVHEILGEIAGREGVAAALRDAAERHVKPASLRAGGWSLPRTAVTWMSPSTRPPPSYLEEHRARTGTVLLAPSSLGAGTMRLPGFPVTRCALAPAQPLEELEFDVADPDCPSCLRMRRQARSTTFKVECPGLLAGFAFHITVDCGGGAPEISSAQPGSHWANVFLMCESEEQVEVGDSVDVVVNVDLMPQKPVYRVSASLRRLGSSGEAVPLVSSAEF